MLWMRAVGMYSRCILVGTLHVMDVSCGNVLQVYTCWDTTRYGCELRECTPGVYLLGHYMLWMWAAGMYSRCILVGTLHVMDMSWGNVLQVYTCWDTTCYVCELGECTPGVYLLGHYMLWMWAVGMYSRCILVGTLHVMDVSCGNVLQVYTCWDTTCYGCELGECTPGVYLLGHYMLWMWAGGMYSRCILVGTLHVMDVSCGNVLQVYTCWDTTCYGCELGECTPGVYLLGHYMLWMRAAGMYSRQARGWREHITETFKLHNRTYTTQVDYNQLFHLVEFTSQETNHTLKTLAAL